MTSEQLFVLVIAVVMIIVAVVVAIIEFSGNRRKIKRLIWDWLQLKPRSKERKRHKTEQPAAAHELRNLTAEESKAELDRLHKLIQDRKQIARESDISYHLWGLYKNHFRNTDPDSLDPFINYGEWYDVKILRSGTADGLNRFEFELKGARYKFVDDEEKKGWSDNIKRFSLFLYDASDRCLIEVPMKVNVDRSGRRYSISSNGPTAFLPSDWINDFINVKLKHQQISNQEIRTQQHQERLREIQDLKERYGISD